MNGTYKLYPEVVDNKFIDIEEVIRSKNPNLLNILPSFVINYLKKIIHQNDLNTFLKNHGNETGFAFVHSAVKEFRLSARIIGEENIPSEGRYIIAANHPIGGPEAILLMHLLQEYRKDMKFLVNDILMNIRNLSELFLPVNKHGSYSKDAAIQLENAFKSDSLILTFPFGLVSRRKDRLIRDLEWKKSFISKARIHQRDIIPVHISGRNSNFFYNLSNIRKALGIKANLEMLFLVSEMFKHKGETIEYIFGKAIPYQHFTKDKNDKAWAEMLRNHLYQLPQNIDQQFK